MKSLRCELVTFIELNRQRQLAFARLYGTDFQTAREKYAYLELHELFAAGVYVNFEVLESAAVAGAVDRQIPFSTPGDIGTVRFGASYGESRTYTMSQTYVLSQSAELLKPKNEDDLSFACYRDVPPPAQRSPEYLLALAQGNSGTDMFQRIRVNGGPPLAEWLVGVATEMSTTYLSREGTEELLYPGQLSYKFEIVAQPAAEARFTLVASPINPAAVGGGLSAKRTSNFQFVLNTEYAPVATGARTGSAIVEQFKKAAGASTPRPRTARAAAAVPPRTTVVTRPRATAPQTPLEKNPLRYRLLTPLAPTLAPALQ